MDFYKKYPSGLRLVARKMESINTVCVGVYVDVGSVREDEKTNGYSHFIEHLLFKGTEKRTALQISEEIDDIGANLNAYTAKDCTCFYTKGISYDLEKCVDLLSDMYFNANFPQNEFDLEKGVVLEEIKMCEDTPDDVSQDLIAEALFNNQSMAQTILGKADNIKYSDRHSIQNFKNSHYFAANTVISVVGAFDFEQLDKLVLNYFESNMKPTDLVVLPEPNVQYKSDFVHKFKDIEQVHLEMAFGSCPLASKNTAACTALSTILGGGFSSRLFQTIREKHGLAYSVYAYQSCYSNCGTFEIYVGTSPNNVTKVCGLLRDEINLLLDKGITQKELNRAVVQGVNALYVGAESNLTVMRVFGRTMLKLGEVYSFEKRVEEYKSLTVDDVNKVARELFSQKPATSYLGQETPDFSAISKVLG